MKRPGWSYYVAALILFAIIVAALFALFTNDNLSGWLAIEGSN